MSELQQPTGFPVVQAKQRVFLVQRGGSNGKAGSKRARDADEDPPASSGAPQRSMLGIFAAGCPPITPVLAKMQSCRAFSDGKVNHQPPSSDLMEFPYVVSRRAGGGAGAGGAAKMGAADGDNGRGVS